MEFRVGDKVRIRKNLVVGKEYGDEVNFIKPMSKYKGKVAIITEITPYKSYKINLDNEGYYWVDEMFEEKHKKTFFKKLPNDYTGIIEVENGYIVEKEILDEEEKEYLSAVIRPFRDRVDYIAKQGCEKEYIKIELKNENYWQWFSLPYFEKGTMYKGMEIDKAYTLKELGLDE